jgi:hypothetical protein
MTCRFVAGDNPLVLVTEICNLVEVFRNQIRFPDSFKNFAAGRRTEVAVVVVTDPVKGSNVVFNWFFEEKNLKTLVRLDIQRPTVCEQ